MRRILYIGNKLEKHGAAPTSVDTLPALIEKEGFKFKSVSSVKNKPLRLLHMLWSVLMNIQKKDLVLIDTYSTFNFWYSVLCGQVCFIFNIPYIFILHGGNLKSRFDRSSNSILKIFRNANFCVVPSNFLKDELAIFSFKNLKYIPNSIDLSFYSHKYRKNLDPKLIWVRAFDEVYNPGLAIRVLERLLKSYPTAELCMVGPEKDGSRGRLEKIVKKRNLPVKLTGKLSKEDWTTLSKGYDIFLNTTSIDNTPVSVMEAMALGLPVVSTNVGGIPYLIQNGVNGLLVESNDCEDMATAVEALISDPELAHKLSSNGKKSVESFDWEKVKPLWLELLA
ncbi:glycosyltransferase family 4 protein [Gramella sp. MT6]|uniref:glycosyltransferase family 4 protein n=1 Tax=Gramella sp. MT6 TaxID=2705471 RepID=UPI001C5EDE50|nr:glycosyltransferase family 4 protein [Gramella sp. MT6]QYA24001.1 glycosyltransferase family 4 protein [Gramella sp. MT6]